MKRIHSFGIWFLAAAISSLIVPLLLSGVWFSVGWPWGQTIAKWLVDHDQKMLATCFTLFYLRIPEIVLFATVGSAVGYWSPRRFVFNLIVFGFTFFAIPWTSLLVFGIDPFYQGVRTFFLLITQELAMVSVLLGTGWVSSAVSRQRLRGPSRNAA